MSNQPSEKRDTFASSLGILLAMTGSAVGLGNLWRFPYLVGENGGAAFILVYLLFVVFICLPIMMCEFILGRRSQANAFGAFKKLAPGTPWKHVGMLSVLAAAFILSFYSVVGGWSIKYLVMACGLKFTSPEGILSETMFNSFVTSTWPPIIYTLIFLACSGIIIVAGVKNGIEKFTKSLMPVLFVLMVILAVRSMTLPGSGEGVRYLFKPDFSKFTAASGIAALGQAFFSLSLGCGTILTYASYVSRSENIVKCSAQTTLLDTLFALIAGCAIMPAVFAYGISPGQGPGLVFVTLPAIFSELPAGGFAAIIFFVSLFLAALTSAISLLEVVIAFLIEECKLRRPTAVAVSMSVFVVLAVLCSLSQGVLSHVKIFSLNIFDLFDYVSANVLMTFGALFAVIFVGHKLKREDIEDELSSGGRYRLPKGFASALYFIIRWAAPVVIIGLLVAGLIS
ncbi:MAG: sodium-dependent transporter [Bacteroidales bacterium]|nr:sodium-dependent transporter [Bacteroidales bacterium]MBO7479727.1 sodium-dependent transporter [Bacteroidales bacterium]